MSLQKLQLVVWHYYCVAGLNEAKNGTTKLRILMKLF